MEKEILKIFYNKIHYLLNNNYEITVNEDSGYVYTIDLIGVRLNKTNKFVAIYYKDKLYTLCCDDKDYDFTYKDGLDLYVYIKSNYELQIRNYLEDLTSKPNKKLINKYK